MGKVSSTCSSQVNKLSNSISPQARLYSAIATYYLHSAPDLTKAEDLYGCALSVASQCNSDTSKVRPLGGLALTGWYRGNYSRALGLVQEIHTIARASGNTRGELHAMRLQAMCYSSMGDFKQCIKCVEEGKELVIRGGLQGGQMESMPMGTETKLYQHKTEYSNPRRIKEAILHQTSAVLSPVGHAYALANIAFLNIVTGAGADSLSCSLNAAMIALQSAQYPRSVSWCEFCYADLRQRDGDVMGARVEYMRLFAAAHNSDDELACKCLAKLADPTNLVHADTESVQWVVVFLAYALRPLVRSMLMVHQALRRFGDVFMRQGADDTALSILTVALGGSTQMDVQQSRAECMCTMGDVYVQHGDLYRARKMWEAARPLFKRLEHKKQVAEIDERLQMLAVWTFHYWFNYRGQFNCLREK